MSIGGHQSPTSRTDEWITPQHIIKALGRFDLDPCAAIKQPWPCARTSWTILDDGLSRAWSGRVWLNPPYGRKTAPWMERMARHGYGTALVFARTETRIFFPWVWDYATAVLFLRGRLHFCRVDGTSARGSGAPSVLVAYGNYDAIRLAVCGLPGAFLRCDSFPRQTG